LEDATEFEPDMDRVHAINDKVAKMIAKQIYNPGTYTLLRVKSTYRRVR
jgi:hypothetical protein